MKWFKHILVVVALLVVAMPHTHAADHEPVSDRSDAPASLVASHACHCHACDETTFCPDKLEMPQDSTGSTAVAPSPASDLQLFVFTESRPVRRPAPSAATGPLTGLKTVQLLI